MLKKASKPVANVGDATIGGQMNWHGLYGLWALELQSYIASDCDRGGTDVYRGNSPFIENTVTKTAIPQMPINKRVKALSSSGRGPMPVLEMVNCDGLFPCTMGQFSQQTVDSVDVDSGWQKCQERSESKIEDKWREKIKFWQESRNSSGEALDTIYSKYFEITNTNIIYLRYIYHSNTQPN